MEKSYDQKNKRVEIYSDDLKEEILENIKKLELGYRNRPKIMRWILPGLYVQDYAREFVETIYRIYDLKEIDLKLAKDCWKNCRDTLFRNIFPELASKKGEKMINESIPIKVNFLGSKYKCQFKRLLCCFIMLFDYIIFEDPDLCKKKEWKRTSWWRFMTKMKAGGGAQEGWSDY